MRLHHLSITAFGPFAGTVEVDFDQLATGGLFLLTGATGAGKTSVLDAVCFALYGQVPGDRAGAKHLRSDHAPADREPRVVLDLSIADRRFRFTRSPSWSRPKRRGSGFTVAPAHVVVEEHRAGTWTALTNRLEDAGLLVGDLLGMNCTQFTQVAMLPQGRFQAFLRASSAERHDVLQKLFRTDRFERVERWLVDRRVEARRAAETGEQRVREVLTRLQESGAVSLPTEWAESLETAGDDGRIGAWTAELAEAAGTAVADAEDALAAAEERAREARDAVAEVKSRLALVERGRRAQQVLADHEASAEDRASARIRLDASRRAAPLDTLLTRAQAADAAARHATAGWRATARRLLEEPRIGLPAEPEREDLVRARAQAGAAHAAALAFLPRQRELDEAERRRTADLATLAGYADALDRARADLEALPARLAAAEERRERCALAAGRLADVRARVDRWLQLAAADQRLRVLETDLEQAQADLSAATADALALKEQYLVAWEARINGMAAELAGALAVGCECPVCGSADHPSPARATSAAVSREDENAARRRYDDAAFVEVAHQTKVAGLEAERAAVSAQVAGVDRDALATEVAAARTELAATEADAAGSAEAERQTATLRTAVTDAQERAAALALRQAGLEAEIAERSAGLAAWAAERSELLGEEATDLESLLEGRRRLVDLLESAIEDHDAALTANRTAAQAHETVADAAAAAGFDTAVEAIAALLPAAEATALEERLAAADAARLAAEATLADPEVLAAQAAPPADPQEVLAGHEEAARAVRETAARASAARSRLARLGELDSALVAALTRWEPLRARHRLVAELASLVEGRSADNPLRMRLAAYVLAERLGQVVAAANERLRTMTDARFSLEHVLDRGVGEQRGGLSLRVRDDWNGVDRDPATLSGGETFVVSLALALGLADTVAHEAGGTDIDTLFIDEGFGSLDADTLEDVMDTLDTLRDGGRVVGLVSHVPELRSRITAQLEVTKGRTGSTLAPRVAVG